ncbi:hypothetical protein B0H21DRAFT_39150 [Amylocystis lapponica]|nr:hypothetical protein B0H21DRAFT_39150 [Amylocystis lapponica]
MARTTRGSTPAPQYHQKQEPEEEEEDEQEGSDADIYGDHDVPKAHANSEYDGDALFSIEGRPARFHMYKDGYGSITQGQIDVLEPKIIAHGGQICDNEEDADTIIVNEDGVDYLERKWWKSRTIYVCPPRFVQMCINTRQYVQNLPGPTRKGMGGLPSNLAAQRMPYTVADEENLVKYLAHVVPKKEEGGRGGMVIYERLIEDAQRHEKDRWGKRHPASSWQNYYKKHQRRLDPMIARQAAEDPPRADGKGQYERTRLANKHRGVHGGVYSSESESDVEDVVVEDWDPWVNEEDVINVDAPGDGSQDDRQSLGRRRRPEREGGALQAHDAKKRARQTESPEVEQARHAKAEIPHSSPDDVRPHAASSSRGRQTPFNSSPHIASSARRKGPTPFFGLDFDDHINEFVRSQSEQRQGPESAGPSGTQRTPTPAPAPAPRDPRPRPLNRTHVFRSAVPMSSQATLVGTQAGSSQPRKEMVDQKAGDSDRAVYPRPHGRTPANQDVMLKAKKAKRRINVVPPPPGVPNEHDGRSLHRPTRAANVEMPPPPPPVHPFETVPSRHAVPRPADESRMMALAPSREVDVNDEMDVDEPFQDNGAASLGHSPIGQTKSDEADVEDMLAESKISGLSAVASNAGLAEEELDSDDAQVHRSMVVDVQRAASGARSTSRGVLSATSGHIKVKGARKMALNESSEREASQNVDMSSIRTPPVSTVPTSQGSRPSAPWTNPRTPVQRQPTTGSTSSEDTVPMPGTRAKEEKRRQKEELKRMSYEPPSGTRAAKMVAPMLELRSRAVARNR